MNKQINSLIGKRKSIQYAINAIQINPQPSQKEPLMTYLNIYQQQISLEKRLFLRFFCHHCQKIIYKRLYCIPCFAKTDQLIQNCMETYTVISHNYYPLMQEFWPAEHELLLLKAIESNGFGNWKQIQQYMGNLGGYYSIDQLEEHYDRFYGESKNYQPLFCQDLRRERSINRQLKAKTAIKRADGRKQRITNQTEQYEPIKQKSLSFSCYNSKRNEFFTSYNQKLQKSIADLQFKDSDTPQEYSIKMDILQCYTKAIKDRDQKHSMVIRHNLLSKSHAIQLQNQLNTDQYLTHASLLINPLMKYTDNKQYQSMLNSVHFCLKIESMINALKQNRDQPDSSLQMIKNRSRGISPKRQNIEGYKPRKRKNVQIEDFTQLKGKNKWQISQREFTKIFCLEKSDLSSYLSNLEGKQLLEGIEKENTELKGKILQKNGISITKLN